MEYDIEVWYNFTQPDGIKAGTLGGSVDAHEFHRIAELTIEADSVEMASDKVYRRMNVVDGDELPNKLGVRSMSCGDALVFKRVGKLAMICRAIGWEKRADWLPTTAQQ